MFSLLALWAILGVIFTFTGMPILYACKAQTCLQKNEDRIFVAIWLGIIALANMLLLASLVTALTGYVTTFLVAIMLLPYFFRRYEFFATRPVFDFITGAIFIAVTLLVAALAAIMSSGLPEDSGSYHIPMISWLVEYGSVPGVALIHDHFGFTSTWFALLAPLKSAWLQGHLIIGMNSFIFFMMIAQTLMKLHRVWSRQADVGDWFFIIFSALFCRFFFAGLIFSPSPDLPATLLIMVTAWLIIALAMNDDANIHSMTRRPGLVALILASGAVSIKFGSMPLLGAAAVYYIFASGFNLRKVWIALAVIAPFIAIHMLVSTITSGCPLYPAPYFCTDLPWSLGVENARKMSSEIFEFAKWVGPAPADANGLNWLWHKPPNNNVFNDKPLMLGLLIINISCGMGLYLMHTKNNKGTIIYTTLIALSGVAFTLVTAPHLRFGLGYFLVVPSLIGALLLIALTQTLRNKIIHLNKLLALLAFIVMGYSVYPVTKFYMPDMQTAKEMLSLADEWIFMPWPPVEALKLEQVKGNNFEYFIPATPNRAAGLCLDAPLPCAQGRIDNVWLRDENAGFQKGFVNNKDFVSKPSLGPH